MAYFISGSSATTASFGHIEIKGTAVNTSGGGGVTISNNSNNRILTGDGTNAAANTDLTWNGTKLSMETYEITPGGTTTTFNSADEDINTVINGFGGNGTFTVGESKSYFTSQNVGIGTTAPAAKLEIQGANGTVSGTPDGDGDEFVIRNNNDAGMSILAGESSGHTSTIVFGSTSDLNGANVFYEYNTKTMKLGTQHSSGILTLRSGNGVDAVTIDASQNVGIGATSPSARLHVKGGNAEEYVIIESTDSGDGIATLQLSTDGGAWLFQNKGTQSDNLVFRRSGAGDFMVIETGGNVGIGTSSPGSTLHVHKASGPTFLRISDESAALGLEFGYENGGHTEATIYNRYASNAASKITHGFGTPSSGNIVMTMLQSGNVGIGTTSPTAKLHIYQVGDATNNEFIMETDSASGGNTGNQYITLIREDTNRGNEIRFKTHAHGGSAVHKFSLGQTDSDEPGVDGTEFYIGRSSLGANPDFTISSDGDVGIGCVANSGIKLRIEDTNPAIRLQASNNGGSVEFLMYPDQASDNVDLRRIKVADGGTMSFESYRGGSGFASDLTLDGATGKVGIGTTTVVQPLTVEGNISGSGTLSIIDKGSSLAATIRATDTTDGYGLAVEGGGTANTRYNVIFRNADASVTYGGISTKSSQAGFWAIGLSPTSTLASTLNINGNVAIGNGYTGTAAPTNGMIVQGNVGIGTATPSNYDSSNDNLVVYGSGHSGITIASGTGNTGGLMFADGTSGIQTYRGYISYNHGSDHLTLGASSSPIAYLKGGKVGIGTSAPDRLLHLAAASPSIMLEDTDVSGLKHQIIGGGNAGLEISVDINNTTTGYLRVDVGGTEKMRLIENGSLGIGTATPIRALDIKATGDPGIRLESAAQSMDVITLRNADGRVGFGGDVITVNNSKVGIGDTSPEAKLEIGISDTTAYSATGLTLDPQTYDALFLDNSANGNMVAINFKVNPTGAGMGRIILERTTTNDGDFVFQLRDPNASTTAKERMRIAGDGHITMGSTDTHTKINGLLTFTDQGSWTSETAGSIRLRNNILYLQYGSSGIVLRAPDGANAFQIDSSDNTTFRGHVNPGSDATYNLGSEGSRWANVFSADLQLSNEGTEGNEVDGTTGSWTIQEGNDDLYLLNRKNGKKYRFKLEEII